MKEREREKEREGEKDSEGGRESERKREERVRERERQCFISKLIRHMIHFILNLFKCYNLRIYQGYGIAIHIF